VAWQEEVVARVNPAEVIGRKTSGWDYAMNVRVKEQVLSPSVEHRKKTDLGAKMLGVEGNFQKSFGAGAEQQIVEELLVLQHEGRELVRQGKNYVEVADGKQFFLASREPAPPSRDLTLGAVSIATGVENDDTVATTGALMEMSTQDCGTAVGNGAEHLLMHPVDPAPVVGDEGFALCPYNVGHL
jgi:hypothetical protein